MFTVLRNFRPLSTATLSATTSSSREALGASPGQSKDVRLVNTGSVVVFFKFGTSTVTAATSDTPLAPGATELFFANDATHVAVITGTGAATVYATTGVGN